MIGGLWLPAVAGIERTPVYIGDYERAVSGVLRTAHVGKAMEWRVLLQGVASEDVEALEEVLRSPVPVGCNIMGTEVIASVTELSSAHNPKRHGPDADWGRMNYEILVREVVVENIMPGFTYEYQAFFDTGSFVWDWDAAGQPDEVDVLLVAGGGGGGQAPTHLSFGGGGGGAGGVLIASGVPVNGAVTGSVGAGGSPTSSGQPSSFGALVAIGGGHGGGTAGGNGGSGGGGRAASGGAGTSEQGNAGGAGNKQSQSDSSRTSYGGGGGGGGASTAGAAGGPPARRAGHGGSGGMGIDLLSVGWNYRLAGGAPRYVGGGGGGSVGGHQGSYSGIPQRGGGGVGGGGAGRGRSANEGAEDGQPNTGGGGGGGLSSSGAGGSGLVIVRWLVSA